MNCPECGDRLKAVWSPIHGVSCPNGHSFLPDDKRIGVSLCQEPLCGGWESHPIHHNKGFSNYHPFNSGISEAQPK